MLTNSEEHRRVFPEPPLIAFRRCKNLKVYIAYSIYLLGLGSVVREMGGLIRRDVLVVVNLVVKCVM